MNIDGDVKRAAFMALVPEALKQQVPIYTESLPT